MKIDYVATLNDGDLKSLDPNSPIIRYEGSNNSFFWRIYGDLLNRDCEIVVPETHQVIFSKGGKLQDVLEGGQYKVFEIEKKGIFGFGKKYEKVAVDVMFISKSVKLNCFWGTKSPIVVTDLFTNCPINLRGNGEFEVTVQNPKKFYLEFVGSNKHFSTDNLRDRLSGRMLQKIENIVANVVSNNSLTFLDIALYKKQISNSIKEAINDMFQNDYGLKIHSFTISCLSIDDKDRDCIEKFLLDEKREIKQNRTINELIEQIDSLQDIKWKQDLFLKILEQADRTKYYKILKILNSTAKQNNFKCPKCGIQIFKKMKFCPNCGENLQTKE